jgi:hypothetical protein
LNDAADQGRRAVDGRVGVLEQDGDDDDGETRRHRAFDGAGAGDGVVTVPP